MTSQYARFKSDRAKLYRAEWRRLLDGAHHRFTDGRRADAARIRATLTALRRKHGDLGLPPPQYLPFNIRVMCPLLAPYLAAWAAKRRDLL